MKGYDSNFLGSSFTALLPDYNYFKGDVAKNIQTNEDILNYTYYSVIQNRSRRLPIFSASNIFRISFEQVGRSGDFRKDNRIKEFEQLLSSDYEQLNSIKKATIHKGHMTKREDVQWDPDGNIAKAQAAAESTFFYPNASPQHARLNIGLWKNLENSIIIKGRVESPGKVSVFTGPVLDKNDPEFNSRLIDGSRFKIPVLFWKVIYYVKDRQLYYASFLMGQLNPLRRDKLINESTTKGLSKARSLKPFLEFKEDEKYQVSVSFIEELTRLKFSKAIDSHEGRNPIELREVQIKGLGLNGMPLVTYSIEGLNV